MKKRERILNKSINNIKININSANVVIQSDKIKEPLVRSTNELLIKDNGLEAIITEQSSNNFSTLNDSAIVGNGVSIIISNVTINNGTVFTNNRNDLIEIIIPESMSDLSLFVDSISGDLIIERLILNKLYAKTISGDITLNDIDALFSRLETNSGDIDATIIESIINYQTFLKTLSGNSFQSSIEQNIPKILLKKHQLNADTLSGDIKILFKGKLRNI